MAKSELRKLNRAELLELLIAQTERADRLAEDLREAKEQIRNREDLIRQAGELAVAASRLIKLLEGEKLKAGYTVPESKPVKRKSVQQAAQQPVHYRSIRQGKGKSNETNGLDIAAIAAITSGIGKGKI